MEKKDIIRKINSRFQKRHQIKLLNDLLSEMYEGHPRYILRNGITAEDILKVNPLPIIKEQENGNLKVLVEYTYPYAPSDKKRMTLSYPHKLDIGLDGNLLYRPQKSLSEVLDSSIKRTFRFDCFMKDTTAISIYI